jgi:hypothetical protein
MYTIQHIPARIDNCDETGITIVQHTNTHTKILGLQGKRQISSIYSAERGSLVTVVNCMSPNEQFIPPLLEFPRKCMNTEMMNGTPPGPIHASHPFGWIQSEIFTQCLLHFIIHKKPTKQDSVIYVPDRNYSHTRNLEVINLARENHVEIICLSPHNSRTMYPWIKISRNNWKHSTPKIVKYSSVQT